MERMFARTINAYVESSYDERTASIDSTVDTPFNLVGTFVGLKRTADEDLPVRCLRILVRKKVPVSKLSNAMKVPKQIDGFPTDVVEVGHIRSAQSACANPRQRIRRPVPCGVSVSGYDTGAGSLGYVFRIAGTSTRVMLSNYHVLAPSSSQSDAVYQPGLGDVNHRPQDIVGDYLDGTPIRFCQRGRCPPNAMDAAIAEIRSGRVKASLCRAGTLPAQLGVAQQADSVWMFGRSSRGVQGVVIGVRGDTIIRFGRRSAWFRNVLEIEPVRLPRFGKPGDSGSVLIDMQRRICGLFFATDGQRNGFATPIRPVVNRFNLAPI